MKIRESQLAISALVETQGQLLVEQIARLDKLEEKINATSAYNITSAEIIKPWKEWLCNYCAMGKCVHHEDEEES